MRSAVDYRSANKKNYINFCKDYPDTKLEYNDWYAIIYSYNEAFREHLVESGEKCKLPSGIGSFAIIKKKRKSTYVRKSDGEVVSNLAIDWQKSIAKGKRIYNFNYHTEGYFFGWQWFKIPTRINYSPLWRFKASRTTSRLLAHYIKVNDEYWNKYSEWDIKPHK